MFWLKNTLEGIPVYSCLIRAVLNFSFNICHILGQDTLNSRYLQINTVMRYTCSRETAVYSVATRRPLKKPLRYGLSSLSSLSLLSVLKILDFLHIQITTATHARRVEGSNGSSSRKCCQGCWICWRWCPTLSRSSVIVMETSAHAISALSLQVLLNLFWGIIIFSISWKWTPVCKSNIPSLSLSLVKILSSGSSR